MLDLYENNPGYVRRLLAKCFEAVVNQRVRAYESGRLKTNKVDAHVICVGNLTVGGTGKTPTVIRIARYFKDQNISTAILSRGYRGKAVKEINIVSDGSSILLDPATAGDEAWLMANVLPGIPVLVGKNRTALARHAISEFKAEVLILDDGFQHLKLKKDRIVLLIDASNPWGNGFLIPAGPLREPIDQAKRADLFLLTRVGDNSNAAREIENRYPGRPVFQSTHKPVGLKLLPDNKNEDVRFLAGERVIGFCALARPESFNDTMRALSMDVAEFVTWPDHFKPGRQRLASLIKKASELNVRHLVTTEKDAIKLSAEDINFLSKTVKLWALAVEIEIIDNEAEFFQALEPAG